MRTLRYFLLYIVVLFPSLGLFMQTLVNTKFNVDEYQHTHLAWMALHAGQFQYHEIWDNHGPLYTLVNIVFLKLLALEANVGTYMAERYLNLFILFLGFIVLFELFRLLTGKWYYAALGPWFFASTLFSIKAIEVRPDNLQCFFLYLALLLLVKAFKEKQNNLAFFSGISLAMMLMTNLKSLAALAAIVISLVLLVFIDKESRAISYLKSLFAGLGSLLLVFVIIFAVTGTLEGYIRDNIIFNFIYITTVPNLEISKILYEYYERQYSLWVFLICSFGFWIAVSFPRDKKVDPGMFIILVITVILALARFRRDNLWTQYDLLFVPLICCMVSSFLWKSLDKSALERINSKIIFKIVFVILFVVFSILGWGQFINSRYELVKYRESIDLQINRSIKLLGRGEHLENFIFDAPEVGFLETASRSFILTPPIMDIEELIFKRSIYGKEYIDLLNDKKVKLLIGGDKVIKFFKSSEVVDFIRHNYSQKDNYWIRKDSREITVLGAR